MNTPEIRVVVPCHNEQDSLRPIANVKFFKGALRFLPTLIKMERFRFIEVPVSTNPCLSGTSHYGVWNRLFKSFRDLLAVRWMKSRAIHYEIAESITYL